MRTKQGNPRCDHCGGKTSDTYTIKWPALDTSEQYQEFCFVCQSAFNQWRDARPGLGVGLSMTKEQFESHKNEKFEFLMKLKPKRRSRSLNTEVIKARYE